MKILIFIPKEYNNIGGFKLPISKYISFIEKEYDTEVIEVSTEHFTKDIPSEVFKKTKNEEIYVLAFTLNVAWKVQKKLKKNSQINIVKKIAFLFDSLPLMIKSTNEFNKNNNIRNDKLLSSLFRYRLYMLKEKNILGNWNYTIYVSNQDINFVKDRYKNINSKIIKIHNGIDLPKKNINDFKQISSNSIKIGYIGGVKNNIDWFIEKWWPKIIDKNPHIELNIAGITSKNGLNDNFIKNSKKVNYLGKVDLDDFYGNMDIIMVAIRKKCGILNKVLEAFAYRVPVIGLENNFLAFEYAKNKEHYLIFNNPTDFNNSITFLKNNKNYMYIINNAYLYVKKYHDWKDSIRKLNEIIEE